MPIKSYLVYPFQGKKTELIHVLDSINHCEFIPAENKELLVLITDTESNAQEVELQEQLFTIKSIKLLTLVPGFNASNN